MKRIAILVVLMLAASVLAPPAYGQAPESDVLIRRTLGGVVHVTASDFEGLGFGYGYAFAEDNLCVGAEIFLTLAAERSRFFPPEDPYTNPANGLETTNLRSDLFHQRINDSGVVERLIAQPPPLGPSPEVKELVDGYASGWNHYVDDATDSGTTDESCAGKPWVRPIEPIDVYRRIYSATTLAGAGAFQDEIVEAAPPGQGSPPGGGSSAKVDLGSLDRGSLAIGSNATALGSSATVDGSGMLLANPHFAWKGPDRFHQVHLTIPGEIDVSGVALYATPAVFIGHNRDVAWTHTVDFVWHFNFYELTLVPGSPTTYVVDGRPEEMVRREVSVEVVEDGVKRTETHTFYETRYGPVFEVPLTASPPSTTWAGQKAFEWTEQRAMALADPNANNMRVMNQLLETARVRDVSELQQVLDTYQGNPFMNTVAADSSGNAYYADHAVVPHVTDDRMARCMSSPTAIAIFAAISEFITLDGSRSDCSWGTDPDAVVDGIFGPSRLPQLTRADYVRNSNDNHWLANPHQPLVGYPQIFGGEQRQPGLRARSSVRIIEDRLSGTDGRDGNRFSLDQLVDVALENRNYAGELVRDGLVAMCEEQDDDVSIPDGSTVDVSEACPVLEAWDLKANLDSRGQLLFASFWDAARKIGAANDRSGLHAGGVWVVPFNPLDPINTPNTLNSDHPQVRAALDGAVLTFGNVGAPLDASVGERRGITKNGVFIPLHGSRGTEGIFNVMSFYEGRNPVTGPETQRLGPVAGSTFIMTAKLKGDCPELRTLLTYSQSTDANSPYHSDQTMMFSNKDWIDLPFCEADVAAQTLSSKTFADDSEEDDGDQDEGRDEDEGRNEDDDEDDGDEDDDEDETNASEEASTASTMTGGRGSLVRTPI